MNLDKTKYVSDIYRVYYTGMCEWAGNKVWRRKKTSYTGVKEQLDAMNRSHETRWNMMETGRDWERLTPEKESN